MAQKKERNKGKDAFWDTALDNSDVVKQWPEWKRSITISSSTASTGKFVVNAAQHKKKK